MVDSDKAQVIDKLKSEYQEAQLEMKRSIKATLIHPFL
jgi:hypothetical protein